MALVSAAKQRPRRIKTVETLSGGSVQVWGENIYYEAAGVAEDGPILLFLHESGGSAATWHGQLVGLAQHARCFVVDLPGHGRSEGLGFRSISGFRDALSAFLDALAIRWPVVVAGVCLGAAVAVDLALHEPERVGGLVLAGLSEGGRAGERVRRQTALGEAPAEFVQALFGHTVSERLLKERLKQWRLTSPVVRHGDLAAMAEYPLRASLLRVRHPALVVAGELDALASPAVARQLAGPMPRSRVVTVPGAGCLVMQEQPGAFNRAVTEFLADLDAAWPRVPLVRHPGGYRRF